MKKSILGAGVLVIALASCKKDSPNKVENMLEDGSWKITLFQEDIENHTVDYTGDIFTFKNDGTVSATHSSTNFSGTWSTEKDDDHTKLNINFSNPSELIDLSDDWHVIEKTDNTLKLEDVSGDGTIDYLTFEKI
ncbi:MAG: hypothetical protein ACK5B9_12270 [Flavobacteriia bacterium]|jgi:hypothetical protein